MGHADAFAVSVSGKVVGHLFQKGDYTWLEWQEGYWDDPQRPVLGLAFEDHPRARLSSALRLPPWFSNLLPEGILREWVARDLGVNPSREMMLLRRLGSDLPGAITVELARTIDAKWNPESVEQNPSGAVAESRKWRFSLAGVALKFSMAQQGERLTLTAAGQHGNWIVKMPDSNYGRVPENEFATMAMAARVGIQVPDTRLISRDELLVLPDRAWPPDESVAYAVRRFDRNSAGERIHMEDLCQVRGFYPEGKYQGSFDTVAALIYRKRELQDYLEFIRRLFFSFAVGNGDMHLKNVSFLYLDQRRPVLSPAYDLVCTAPYRTDDEHLGLKLGRSPRFSDVTPVSFEVLARRVGAPVDATMSAIYAVARRLEAAWEAERTGMQELPRHLNYLDERVPLIAERFR